jgi:predicted nucleic acid-binding protein
MEASLRYLLDTNAVNAAVDRGIGSDELCKKGVYITHIQKNEIAETPQDARRAILSAGLKSLGPKNTPTSVAVYDISEWDNARWSDDDAVYSTLLQRVTELDLRKGRNKKLENQVRDAIIGSTAIKEGLILVTNDSSLTTATTEAGGNVITFEQFAARLRAGS